MSDCCPDHNRCAHAKEMCKPKYCAKYCCDDPIACMGGDDKPTNCVQNKNDLDRILGGTPKPKPAKVIQMNVPDQFTESKYKCTHPGCDKSAAHEVVWMLKSKQFDEPTFTTPIARTCGIHINTNLWAAYHTKEGWKLICETFRELGRPIPKTKHSSIISQPIGTSKMNKPNTNPNSGFTMN